MEALEQKLVRFYNNFGGSGNKGRRSSCDVLANAYVGKVAFRFTSASVETRKSASMFVSGCALLGRCPS